MCAGNVLQVLTLSVKLATFRLAQTTVPWLFVHAILTFMVACGSLVVKALRY
jgi:hypothetical protein